MITRKIIVNGRFFGRRMTGVDRFGTEILRAINELLKANDSCVHGLEFELALPPGVSSARFSHIHQRNIGTYSGQLWEQLSLPGAVKNDDLLLSLCNTGPVLVGNQVVVIHDAATEAIPSAFSIPFRVWYRLLMPMLGRRACKVLTVSNFSRKELIRAFGIADHKIAVVSEGGEHILEVAPDDKSLSRFGLLDKPFVLAVSSMAAHKNFRLVLEALQEISNPPFEVAIAGGANSKVFCDSSHINSKGVHWLGYVSDSELRALYGRASCFVFPSLYEGFGIPPLEAMNCGCPVLAGRAASIPEVCGDAVVYFDPTNAADLAAQLVNIMGSADTRKTLRGLGYEQAKVYSWERAARRVVASCAHALGLDR